MFETLGLIYSIIEKGEGGVGGKWEERGGRKRGRGAGGEA